MFVNTGGYEVQGQDSRVRIEGDSCFQGGDVIETNEMITEGGDCPSLYQSARYGDFCYKFDSLVPGDYFVDLHFAEIVNTNGPKGIRVFNVFVQEEKARYKSLTFNIILQRCVVSERFLSVLELQILSGLDIYSVVGANKPLQLVDLRVSVVDDGNLLVSFEGLSGTPTVSGICIRKAPPLSDLVKPEHLTCSKCATEIEVSPLKIKQLTFTRMLHPWSHQSLMATTLEVRQAAEGFHHVPGIVEAKVENIKEAWDVLQAGSNTRSVGSNNVNEHSSRSHW
ncbi:hypothetical protein B296_00007222 [Ensete ventricosum]|uniref:Malectin domain-containing protein n=1 Tax=Ensete ventricosum TaxID=4639 RepID=A0A427AMU3_ENSVE|nr:hypothetical protein B296_00007222 [Ensete ventricosum]